MDFAKERVSAHNNWPLKNAFKAEAMFEKKLLTDGAQVPFQPIKIEAGKDPDYQRCVGHLLDALDELPHRPDYAFDHFFRTIDIAGSPLFLGKGLKGICQKLSDSLLAADRANWEEIIDKLCAAIPLRTYELLAKRLLAAPPTDSSGGNEALYKRATAAFGSSFHTAFIQKFTRDSGGQLIVDPTNATRQNAAKLLKLYMSGKKGTRLKAASDPALDLTKQQNVPSHRRRSEVLLSLLLFTLRNERAHGNTISPFRTSKATLERYQSYYFIMLASYVYALGLLHIRFNCAVPGAILAGLQGNIDMQRAFFD